MCIFMGCVYAYVIVLTFLGPEYLKRNFDADHDTDLAEAAGHDTIERATRKRQEAHSEAHDASEKGVAAPVEHA